MDNGQNTQSANSQPDQAFFTAGVGTNSETTNNFESENNLDLTNEAATWNSSKIVVSQDIANHAISPSENIIEAPTNPELHAEQSSDSNLGQIINLEMPPTAKQPSESTQNETAPESFTKSYIKTGEKLESSGIGEVDRIISKLNQDGNIVNFYDSARDMMEANLENSYNRKLAA